jgi:hypothetical protein
LWDIQGGIPLGEALRHVDRLQAAAFTDNQRLAVYAGDELTLWDIETGRCVSGGISVPLSKSGSQTLGSRRRGIEFNAPDELTVHAWRGSGLVKVPHGLGTAPEWFTHFAEAVAGMRLTDSGIIEPVVAAPAQLVREPPTPGEHYVDFAKRFLRISVDGE